MNEINVMGKLITDSNIVHDSAKERYRSPLGAVTTGETVTIGLSIYDLLHRSVALITLRGVMTEEHEMNNDGDIYRTTFTAPAEPVALRYWFRVTLHDGSVVHYGSDIGNSSGIGKVYLNEPPSFQLTVFDGGFHTPAWAKDAVMYQIFPDRFACGNPKNAKKGVAYHNAMGRDIYLHSSWDDPVDYLPSSSTGHYRPVDLFGGDLEGIRGRLPQLKELGVTVVYLNPIFEAASNHRYNTADYLTVDPALGTNDDFMRLAEEARAMGIRIILDGVFSHTGDDSIYFDRYGKYEGAGAYESKDSPYYSWYRFSEYPDKYDSWWGFDTLPEVEEGRPDWINFIIKSEDSVLKRWIARGASGFRLDVADELPDDIIDMMRSAIKEKDGESFLIGEVWEDATSKRSYNQDRLYALGRGLDSVMNYPFASSTVAFLRGHMNAYEYRGFLVSQSQNYPKEMYYSLMNLLSSHDIARIRAVLSADVNPSGIPREDQARFQLTEKEYAEGGELQKIAAAIQFSIPGIPSIYYGDEVGMTGLLDPFNRQPYHVKDEGIRESYKWLAATRNSHQALRTGSSVFYSTNGNVLGILRFIYGGKDAFMNEGEDSFILMVCNPADAVHRIVIDLHSEKECMTAEQMEMFRQLEWQEAIDLYSGEALQAAGGLLEINLPPVTARFYRLTWK